MGQGRLSEPYLASKVPRSVWDWPSWRYTKYIIKVLILRNIHTWNITTMTVKRQKNRTEYDWQCAPRTPRSGSRCRQQLSKMAINRRRWPFACHPSRLSLPSLSSLRPLVSFSPISSHLLYHMLLFRLNTFPLCASLATATSGERWEAARNWNEATEAAQLLAAAPLA